MRFTEFALLQSDYRLVENKQQYKQIMDTIVKTGAESKEKTDEILREIRLLLKRSDRITWWLLHYRELVLGTYIKKQIADIEDSNLDSNEAENRQNELKNQFQKFIKKPYESMDRNLAQDFSEEFDLDKLRDHWSAMLEQAEPVAEVRWEADLTARELLTRLETAEEEWRKASEKEVEMQGDDKIIIDYGDKAWVMLDRPACEAEGRAMGHCGNRAEYHPDDRILSFRTIKSNGKHEPHLTFIRDGDGYLGEMKGRANKKPARKYHKYIKDLLLSNYVHSIKGGGYMPDSNFEMKDLPEKYYNEVIQEKPRLSDLTAHEMIQRGLDTQDAADRLEIEMKKNFLPFRRIENGRVVVHSTDDIKQMLHERGDNLKSITTIMAASGVLQDNRPYSFYKKIPKERIIETVLEVYTDIWKTLVQEDLWNLRDFVRENYQHIDPTETPAKLIDSVPEIQKSMTRAVEKGLYSGIEKDLIEDFTIWLNDHDIHVNKRTGDYDFIRDLEEIAHLSHQVGEGEMEESDFVDALVIKDEFEFTSTESFDADSAKKVFIENLKETGVIE